MSKLNKASTIGRFFKKKREDNRLSQGELSEALGYTSSQFVSNWERGLCSPPLAIIPKLAKILNIPKREILDLLTSEYRKGLEQSFKNSKIS